MAPLEDETKEIIRRVTAKRRRRKALRIMLVGLGAAVVLAGLITGVVLAASGPGEEASSSTPSSVLQASTTEGTDTTLTTLTTTSPSPASETPGSTPAAGSAPSEASVTTSAPDSTAASAPATTTTTNWLAGKVIVIDPGHQARADSALEPIGPGSSTKKAKVSGGTSSRLTGIPESQVALEVGLKLREALEGMGITVVMTRDTQDIKISNIERARVGNQANADLCVRLHCNGSTDPSVHGLFTLYPASIKGWTDDIATVSKRAAEIAQADLIVATGAQDQGIRERSDLTGFNWSDVPVILVEMGYMTNATEDKQLRSPAYQNKLVQGLARGIIDFLKTEREAE